MDNTAVSNKTKVRKWTLEEYKRWEADGEMPDGKPAPDHSTSCRSSRAGLKHLPEDLCESKHGGDFASILAHEKVKPKKAKMYAELREVFEAHGELTTHEIATILGKENRNQFAPRLTEMRAYGWVERTGEMKGGCHVLRLVRQ